MDIASHWAAPQSVDHSGRRALLLGFVMFVLLWILSIPYRAVYLPNGQDLPLLADGLLLAPGSRWQDWFIRGHSDFWDAYPEWPPPQLSGVTRPALQFVIYLLQFALGRDWASYQVINCFAAAGLAAVSFQIAQTALGLRTSLSLLTAILVVSSPPVLQCWVFGLAFATEPLATLFVAGAFLAVFARRDFLCLAFLFAALLNKENAVWAPLAAAITIMLRPRPDELLRRRAFTAALMFLPVLMWLCLRFAFFGGIGGTHATAGYTPLTDFLILTFHKLKNMHHLFVSPHYFLTEVRSWSVIDRTIFIGASLLVYALLLLWALRMLEMVRSLGYAMHEARCPTVEATFLVTVWAAIALAFHFALPISDTRYATSFVVFAWPALVAEVERRSSKDIIRLGVVVCCLVALVRSSYYIVEWSSKSVRSDYKFMDAVLREAPTTIQQIYVLPGYRNLPSTNPKYLRPILDVSAEIVRVADIWWECRESSNSVAFDHNITDGIVNLTVTLPDCAKFYFFNATFAGTTLANGHLYRNPAMSYELPEAHAIRPSSKFGLPFSVGRKMTVHVRPTGPARFIIDHSGPNGIAWFDIS